MKIAGINAIQDNNSLRSNTDTKVRYNSTPDIAPDSFEKSTPTQPTKAQNVSFGHMIIPSFNIDRKLFEQLKKCNTLDELSQKLKIENIFIRCVKEKMYE